MSEKSGTVLFLSQDASRTGAPKALLYVLRWLRQNRNLNFQILIGRSWGDLFAEFAAVGIVHAFTPKHTLFNRMLRRLKLDTRLTSNHLSRLKNILLHSDIKLIYANSAASAPMVEFLSFLKCPVICHIHELESSIRRLDPDTMSILKKYASMYITVSAVAKQNLIQQHGVEDSKIQVIEGMVPIAEYLTPESGQVTGIVNRELDIASDAKIVCACGSVDLLKGTDLFLKVAEYVTQHYRSSPVHFIWIGGRPDAVKEIRKQVQCSSVRHTLHFIGQRLNIIPYLDASDLLLLTSREESLSLVMVEAALRQRPIICFNQSGNPPDFVEQDAGIVIPDFDTRKMGEAVIELLSNPDLRGRMGRAAKQKALIRYDLNEGASRIASIIKSRIPISREIEP